MTNKYMYIFLILFIILNSIGLKSFYYNKIGNNLFNKGLYIDSKNTFNKANNIQGVYNKANSLYKKAKYKESIKEYISIQNNDKTKLNFSINHNIGNSYFRLGENIEEKISHWEKSVEYYNKALDIQYNKETKDNLEFVLNRIKEEKDKEDDKNEEKDDKKNKQGDKSEEAQKNEGENGKENQKEKTGSGSKSEGNKASEDGEKKEGNKKKEEGEGEGKKGEETMGEKVEENKMTENQEKALEQYQKALKQAEQENQDGFNKVYQQQNNNDPFEAMFNNNLLNNNGGEKDW